MQKPFERHFLDLMHNVLPSVHLHVDQIASEQKRAKSVSWPWLIGPKKWKTFQRPFNEADVQWVTENMAHLRPEGCPPVIVNKKLGSKFPDYRFVGVDSPTFEVKGPVRDTFFKVEKLGKNWTKPVDAKGGSICKDVRKILTNYCRSFPRSLHYLVLLLPCSIEALPDTFNEIMASIAKENAGIAPYTWQFEQVQILARTTSEIVEQLPLTIAMSPIALQSKALATVR